MFTVCRLRVESAPFFLASQALCGVTSGDAIHESIPAHPEYAIRWDVSAELECMWWNMQFDERSLTSISLSLPCYDGHDGLLAISTSFQSTAIASSVGHRNDLNVGRNQRGSLISTRCSANLSVVKLRAE